MPPFDLCQCFCPIFPHFGQTPRSDRSNVLTSKPFGSATLPSVDLEGSSMSVTFPQYSQKKWQCSRILGQNRVGLRSNVTCRTSPQRTSTPRQLYTVANEISGIRLFALSKISSAVGWSWLSATTSNTSRRCRVVRNPPASRELSSSFGVRSKCGFVMT
jgi:hypothetical protein